MDWGLYPVVARASSLQAALQAELDRTCRDLTATVLSSSGWRDVGAVVRSKDRSVDVVMASQTRDFTCQFWDHGVLMAHGGTADVSAVAGGIRVWLDGALLQHLNAASPFVTFSPFSEAHERGEGIGFKWQQYHDNVQQASHLRALHSFIAAAMREPRLRALFPFTSMDTLGFRPTVQSTTRSDGPWVRPLGDDRYLVMGPGNHEVGVADADGSVVLALTVLDAIAEK